MSTNKILIAGIIGGVVAFLLGYLIWGMLLSDFMKGNMGGEITGFEKTEFVWWMMLLGNIAWGLLYAIIFGRWANIRTIQTGAIAGAVIALLIGVSYDFGLYSYSNMMNMTAVFVDILAGGVLGAVVGAVVAWVLGYGEKA